MQDSQTRSFDCFDHRLRNLPASIWQNIAHIDELKGRWVGSARLNPTVLGRLRRSVLVTSTGASTRIEGARASDDEVERLMRGLSMQHLADRDAQEVRGYYEALQSVFDSWAELGLTENNIKQLQVQLLRATTESDNLQDGRGGRCAWLTFFTEACLAQAVQADVLVSGASIEHSLSPSQLKIWQYLADGAVVSPAQIAQATGVPRRIVNQVLDKLLRLRCIERLGEGRATRYRRRDTECTVEGAA